MLKLFTGPETGIGERGKLTSSHHFPLQEQTPI